MAELVSSKPPDPVNDQPGPAQAPLMPNQLEPGVGIAQLSRQQVEQMRAGLSSVGPLTHAVLHNNGQALLSLVTAQTVGAPIGSLVWFAGTSAPSGFLLADGSAVSRTLYADLFSIIGTTYGAGDGSTTFALPSILSTTGIYVVKF